MKKQFTQNADAVGGYVTGEKFYISILFSYVYI